MSQFIPIQSLHSFSHLWSLCHRALLFLTVPARCRPRTKSLEQCLRLSKSDEDKQCKNVLALEKGKEADVSRMSARASSLLASDAQRLGFWRKDEDCSVSVHRPDSTSFSNSSWTTFFFSAVTLLNPSRHATKFVLAEEIKILSTWFEFWGTLREREGERREEGRQSKQTNPVSKR